LRLYLAEKALYELRYELDNRPEWVRIPLRGLLTTGIEGTESG
jgi:maltose alpha-D-glucosyltransferase/alpha-amylase